MARGLPAHMHPGLLFLTCALVGDDLRTGTKLDRVPVIR